MRVIFSISQKTAWCIFRNFDLFKIPHMFTDAQHHSISVGVLDCMVRSLSQGDNRVAGHFNERLRGTQLAQNAASRHT